MDRFFIRESFFNSLLAVHVLLPALRRPSQRLRAGAHDAQAEIERLADVKA